MVSTNNLKKLSFLIYGLGLTGKSVISFFKKNKIKKYQVLDDKNKLAKSTGYPIPDLVGGITAAPRKGLYQ